MTDDNTNYTAVVAIGMFIFCGASVFFMFSSANFLSAGMVDFSNVQNQGISSFFPYNIIPTEKTFVQNESYLKYTFDGLANYDQVSYNRGIDFKKCYKRDSHELFDAISSDAHYVKIRGNTPDEALKTISLPGVMLNAGFSIPDPSKLYVSECRQVAPDEYKMWIITKQPVVETIDGALESTCKVSYYY